MTAGWDSFDRPSQRETAMLSEVLDSLRTQLGDSAIPSESDAADGIEELISAAVSELHRLNPVGSPAVGGIAPVLGSGVLQELLRRRREKPSAASEDVAPQFDQRR
jgi:hypothetical protein